MYYNIIKLEQIPKIVFAHIYSCHNYGSVFKPMAGNIEIAYIKAGNLEFEISGKRFTVKEGSFLVFPHKYDITVKSEETKEHVHYTISAMLDGDAQLLDKICKNLNNDELCIPMCIENCEKTEFIFSLLCEAINEYQKGDNICGIKSGALFLQILCELANLNEKKNLNKKDEVIDKRIKKYIEKNLNRRLTLSDISENIGKNPNYLNQIFKKINNMSIISYVNLVKMRKAAVLIADEHMTLKAVANMVGIHDINYFYRLFKSKMGMSVSDFKTNLIDNTYFLCDLEEVSK